MSKYRKVLKRYKILNHPQWNELEISVSYEIGGHNYFTGDMKARGLELHCTPQQRTENSRIVTGFSGIYKAVLDMNRFSAKTLREFQPSQEDYDAVKNHVINKHKLEIDELN
tara:strand:+ start:4130 stop:4465 length:336 start_codon:yes stop_codon:yes gene_type:complete